MCSWVEIVLITQCTRKQNITQGNRLRQTLLVSSCFYSTLYKIPHQNFYSSWEFFTSLAIQIPRGHQGREGDCWLNG